MWRKHHNTFLDHVKYIHNDIVKPFRTRILQCAECVRNIHDLSKYMHPTPKKGGDCNQADWNVCNKENNEDEICIATKDIIPTSMQHELENNSEEYRSTPHEEWCDLLSTMDVKDNRKRAAAHIKS